MEMSMINNRVECDDSPPHSQLAVDSKSGGITHASAAKRANGDQDSGGNEYLLAPNYIRQRPFGESYKVSIHKGVHALQLHDR